MADTIRSLTELGSLMANDQETTRSFLTVPWHEYAAVCQDAGLTPADMATACGYSSRSAAQAWAKKAEVPLVAFTAAKFVALEATENARKLVIIMEPRSDITSETLISVLRGFSSKPVQVVEV